mmetsp:Transcript_5708/g.8371  ORF Transcript_5708/g.8371 Transcript_5708/m.8371 type:complete len:504 (+) Transcript_5708:560-2071(+)
MIMSNRKKWSTKLGKSPTNSSSSSSSSQNKFRRDGLSSSAHELHASKSLWEASASEAVVRDELSKTLSSSPSTVKRSVLCKAPLTPPPRKVWEWHYRSFLSKSKLNSSSSGSTGNLKKLLSGKGLSSSHQHHPSPSQLPTPPLLQVDDDGMEAEEDGSNHSSSTRSKFRGLSLTPKSKKRIDDSVVISGASLPMPLFQRVSSAPDHKQLTHQMKHHQQEGRDNAVRGGSLFASAFSKHPPHSSSTPTTPSAAATSTPSSAHLFHMIPPNSATNLSKRCKSKSCDDLDSSVRNGHSKNYSSSSNRAGGAMNVMAKSTSAAIISSTQTTASSSVSRETTRTPSSSPLFYHPTTTAVSSSFPTTNYLPKAPSSFSQMMSFQQLHQHQTNNSARDELDVTIKKSKRKAFTEFHNSTSYGGKDSTCSYLGDEKSVSRQNHFGGMVAAMTTGGGGMEQLYGHTLSSSVQAVTQDLEMKGMKGGLSHGTFVYVGEKDVCISLELFLGYGS